MEHKHLCRDCGKELYSCSWCDEKENHGIGGRCAECQKTIGKVWVICLAHAYGVSIHKAQYDYEHRDEYSTDYKPYIMVGLKESIDLPFITWKEDFFSSRKSDGVFKGCSNSTYIISEEEKEYFIYLNNERKQAIEKVQKEIEDKERAETEKIFNTAKITGIPQEISTYTIGCNDEQEECSTDIITIYANPDGTTTKKRQHTW
jgi:hypothetical protein